MSVECPGSSTECILRNLEAKSLIQPPREQQRPRGRNLNGGARGRGNRYRPDCWTDDEQSPHPHAIHPDHDAAPSYKRRQGRRLYGYKQSSGLLRQDRPWRRKRPCLWQEEWGPESKSHRQTERIIYFSCYHTAKLVLRFVLVTHTSQFLPDPDIYIIYF